MARFLWFLGSLLLVQPVLDAGSIFDITDLGTLGGAATTAFGVNASGFAVGFGQTVAGYNQALLFQNGAIANLTANSTAVQGQAAGINDANQVAGTSYSASGNAQATVWSGGTTQSLGTLGGTNSYGMAINANGDVVGGAETAAGEGHAFLSSGGAMYDLGTFGGGSWSAAYSVNSRDQVAGYGMIAGGVFRGFSWDADSGFTVLGTLGGANSYAMAINGAGQLTGSSNLADGATHAFLYASGTMRDLGSLGGSSYAYGIDNSGEVVGYSSLYGGGDTHAFAVINGVMFDLNSLLAPGSGWLLTAAYGINESGQIVGTGWHDGALHAFLATDPPSPDDSFAMATTSSVIATPEPGTLPLVAAALLLGGAFSLRKLHNLL